MQDLGYGLPRTPLPRTRVNKPMLGSSLGSLPPTLAAAQARDGTARALPGRCKLWCSPLSVLPQARSHSLSHPRCNLDSHRANNKPPGRNDAAFDTTASRRQYPPAITEGGLPAGRSMTGAAAAHAQFPNPVPTSSSSTAIKKEAAYTTARGLLISTTKIGKNNAPKTSTHPKNRGATVRPPTAHSVAQARATCFTVLPRSIISGVRVALSATR